MGLSNDLTPADLGAIVGNNDGFGGGNGAWWIIILFLFAFCGWGGRGFGGSGGASVADNYVLASDFSQIERKLDSISNGLCDGFYGQAQLSNGLNTAIFTNGYETRNAITQDTIANMQSFNALQAQLAQCCCDNKQAIAGINYNLATNTNSITNAINQGFCQTNYNINNAVRDITENANCNTKAILDFLVHDKMHDLQRENDALRLSASQNAQSAYLISQLRTEPTTTATA